MYENMYRCFNYYQFAGVFKKYGYIIDVNTQHLRQLGAAGRSGYQWSHIYMTLS